MPTKQAAKKTRKLTDFEVFTVLNDAVSAQYWEDACKAGVITSTLSHDPPQYYVAVARYHNHHSHKQIITSATKPTLREALHAVADEWVTKVRTPPKETLLDKLANCFTGKEQAAVNEARK